MDGAARHVSGGQQQGSKLRQLLLLALLSASCSALIQLTRSLCIPLLGRDNPLDLEQPGSPVYIYQRGTAATGSEQSVDALLQEESRCVTWA